MMQTSEQIGELAAALAKAQGTFPSVKTDSTAKIQTTKGGEYSYTYASLAATLEVIRKPLADNGLSVAQFPETAEGSLMLTTRLMHDTGQWLETTMRLQVGAGDIKTIGSVITYARRYALMAMLGLASDDDDGNDAGKVTPTDKSVTIPPADAATRPDWCMAHNCQMSKHSKDGQDWYSHKLADGTWCNGGKPKAAILLQSESPAPHWSVNEIARKRFFARCKEAVDAAGLSIGYELLKKEALKVAHLEEWGGTEDDAVREIKEYCQAKAAELGAQKMV